MRRGEGGRRGNDHFYWEHVGKGEEEKSISPNSAHLMSF